MKAIVYYLWFLAYKYGSNSMDNSTGDKISLRKATTEEIEYLKAKASKRDKEQRKKLIPIFVFVLLVYLGLTIYKHNILNVYFFHFQLQLDKV